METTTLRAMTIRLHPNDNVVIARETIAASAEVPGERITAADVVPGGHKIATRDDRARAARVSLRADHRVRLPRHRGPASMSTRTIAGSTSSSAILRSPRPSRPTGQVTPQATFQGILRPDGRVATRNYVGILSSVNCSATVSRYIADAFKRDPFTGEGLLADFPNVDGVVALTHRTGCGQASEGDGIDVLRRTMGGFARHANFASTFIVGLGCESNQVSQHRANAGSEDGPHEPDLHDSGDGRRAQDGRAGHRPDSGASA